MSSRLSRLGGAAARGVALLVIATCTSDHVPTAPPHPQTAPVTPTPVSAAITASPQAVQLIGAGNIARCDRTNDEATALDRKSTRLNSSHLVISYAVFCLKKKKK